MSLPNPQRTPATRVNQSFSGNTNRGTGLNTVYLLGEILATGTASDGDVSELISTQEAAEAFAGAQSPLAFMAVEALDEEYGGATVKLKLAACAESAGVAASQTFTFANNAGSEYTAEINIGGKEYAVVIPSGSTPTAAGDLLAAKINLDATNGSHPWSAANVTGTVTVTAKWKGSNGNEVTTSVISIGEEATQTLTAGAATMAGGTLAPTLTTILGNLASVDTDFLAVSMTDTTSIEAIRAHLSTKGNPPEQMGCIGIWGGRKSVSLINTDADTIHGGGAAHRMVCFDVYNTDSWPGAMAAGFTTVLASEEDCARPHNRLPVHACKAPPSTDRFIVSECETLLANGVTPGRTDNESSTVVKIVRSVVIRTDLLDPMDLTKIRTMDEYRDRMVAQVETLDRPKLKKDGEPVYTANTVTAASVGSLLKDVGRQMELEDKLQGIGTGRLDERYKNAYGGPGRTEHTVPSDCVDGFHDCAVDQVMILG